MTHTCPEFWSLVIKGVAIMVVNDLVWGLTRYRSFIWFSLVMIGVGLGLALSPVFKLFKGRKKCN